MKFIDNLVAQFKDFFDSIIKRPQEFSPSETVAVPDESPSSETIATPDESPSSDTVAAPDESPSPHPYAPEAPKKKKTEKHHVAGEAYRLKNILDLMGECPYYSYSKKELIELDCVDERVYKYNSYTGTADLVPEPENPHDSKAIKVMVEGAHIGYIKAGSCAHIHKLLREDLVEKVNVEIKGGDYKIVNEDFDDVTEKSTYTLERGSLAINAVITLTLK